MEQRSPEEEDMYNKVNDIDNRWVAEVNKDLEAKAEISEFKKLWKYQTPVYAFGLGTIFCVSSGVVQPATGIVFSGLLGVLTVPLDQVWRVAELIAPPGEPEWAISYTKE